MNAKSQRASASTLTTYEATRTLGQDVRKVFSADLEQNTSPSVWSRRMGVRGAKQIPLPQDGASASQGMAPTPSPRDVTAASRNRTERRRVSLGASPWPHVEDSPKAPQRAERVLKQVGRKESDSHNTWLPGSAQETLDTNIILLILLLPAFPLHSLRRTSDWLKHEGKDQKHGVILPLLSFQEFN